VSKKPSSDAEGNEPPVVEGEVLRERKSARDPSAETGPSATPSRWRRAPWYLALAMAIFIGGLFTSPWIEATLRQFFPSLLPPTVNVSEHVAQMDGRLADLSARVDELATDSAAPSQLSQSIMTIEAQVNGLDRRTQQLEAAAAAPPKLNPNAELLVQMAEMQKRLSDLESQNDLASVPPAQADPHQATAIQQGPDVDTGRINQLEMRLGLMEAVIATMQDQDPAQTDSATLLPIAFVALARDMEMARPYDNRLRDIRAVLLDKPALLRAALEPDLALLERSATTGIIALDDLRDQFSPIIAEILKSNAVNAETTWWGRAWADVKGLITVRPIGDAEGEDLAATLARAEFALGQGDVASALGIITAVDIPQSNKMAEWNAQARAYVDAQSALDHAMAVLLDRQRSQ